MRGRLLFWLGPPQVIVLRAGSGESARSQTLSCNPPRQRSTLPPELGRELRQARLQAGLTLKELAAKTGRSWSLLGQLERGTVAPSCPTVLRLAAALDLSDNLEHRLLENAATSRRPIHQLWVLPPRPRWPRLSRRWRSRLHRLCWLLRRPFERGARRFVSDLEHPDRWLRLLQRGRDDNRT